MLSRPATASSRMLNLSYLPTLPSQLWVALECMKLVRNYNSEE
jgi:hypothetical protein